MYRNWRGRSVALATALALLLFAPASGAALAEEADISPSPEVAQSADKPTPTETKSESAPEPESVKETEAAKPAPEPKSTSPEPSKAPAKESKTDAKAAPSSSVEEETAKPQVSAKAEKAEAKSSGSLPDNYPGDADRPFILTSEGVKLTSGTFKSGDHVNTQPGGSIHIEGNGQPGEPYIGKSLVPWSALGYNGGECVTWGQVAGFGYHFGENNENRQGGVDERGWKYCIPGNTPQPKSQYITVLWQVDDWGEGDSMPPAKFPQSYVAKKVTDKPDLGALDDLLKGKCVGFQVDVYRYTKDADIKGVNKLIGSGELLGSYQDSKFLIDGGQGKAWKFYVSNDCTPPYVPPAPDAATFSQFTCEAVGTYTIPSSKDGVVYMVTTDQAGGAKVRKYPGTYYATADGTATGTPVFLTVTIEAWDPNNPAGATLLDSWDFTFSNPGDCTPPPTNTCKPTLVSDTSTNVNPTWIEYDVRATGHYKYTAGSLAVWTDDNTSQAKVSLAHAGSFPLKHTGVLNLDWTGSTPPPGINLFVNFDGTHTGTLVYESVYGQDLWLTGGSSQYVKDRAPVNGGGNGSQWYGTIDQWLVEFPDAQVTGFAFSLGSGVKGEGVINSITVNCVEFTFDVVVPSVTIQATDQVCTPDKNGSPVYVGGTLAVAPSTAKVYKADDVDGTVVTDLTDVDSGDYVAVLSWKNGNMWETAVSTTGVVGAAEDCTVPVPPKPEPRVTTDRWTERVCVVPNDGTATETLYGQDTTYPLIFEKKSWTWVEGEPIVGEPYVISTEVVDDATCFPPKPEPRTEEKSENFFSCEGEVTTTTWYEVPVVWDAELGEWVDGPEETWVAVETISSIRELTDQEKVEWGCVVPTPTPKPTPTPTTPPKEELPRTGGSDALAGLAVVGLVLTLVGGVAVAARRRG